MFHNIVKQEEEKKKQREEFVHPQEQDRDQNALRLLSLHLHETPVSSLEVVERHPGTHSL